MCITEYNEAETMQMFKEEGREEGRDSGVKSTVWACKKANLSESDAVESVMYGMDISQSEAETLVKKYW